MDPAGRPHGRRQRSGFQAFEARDGQNRPVTVDSLAKLRAIERESEQDTATAKASRSSGAATRTTAATTTRHALAPRTGPAGAQPDPAFVKKHAATIRRSTDVADTEYGPGVSDATPSALDSLSKDA